MAHVKKSETEKEEKRVLKARRGRRGTSSQSRYQVVRKHRDKGSGAIGQTM